STHGRTGGRRAGARGPGAGVGRARRRPRLRGLRPRPGRARLRRDLLVERHLRRAEVRQPDLLPRPPRHLRRARPRRHAPCRRFTYLPLFGAPVRLGGVRVFGARVNEARRWFHVGPLSFQPVEIAKLALVVYLAYSLAKKREKVRFFTIGFMPHLAVCGVMMALLLKQPDLGSAIILGATTLVMLFIAGTRLSYILLPLLTA